MKKIFIVTLPELGWDCIVAAVVGYDKSDAINYMKTEYFDTPEEWDNNQKEYHIFEEEYINLCD